MLGYHEIFASDSLVKWFAVFDVVLDGKVHNFKVFIIYKYLTEVYPENRHLSETLQMRTKYKL